MSAPTIIFIRDHYIDGHLEHRRGEECPPGLFPPETIARALDEKYLHESDPGQRPSLFRVFHRFAGCHEDQPLTPERLANFTLPA